MHNYDFHIVAIGSSAGGIPPLKQLVSKLPDSLNAAVVLIPHLYAQHRSRLDEIIAHSSNLPVLRVEKSIPIKSGFIYVLAENKIMTLENGYLKVRMREPEEKINYAIDIFFQSMASEAQTKAIGVVLSGTNADGSEGAKSISAQGGLVMTQDPQTAIYPKMPLEVIRRDDPKVVAPLDTLAAAIVGQVNRNAETTASLSQR